MTGSGIECRLWDERHVAAFEPTVVLVHLQVGGRSTRIITAPSSRSFARVTAQMISNRKVAAEQTALLFGRGLGLSHAFQPPAKEASKPSSQNPARHAD
jgi:hypothetical protein